MRNCILFAVILIFVLFVNSSIIAFDLMYAEQPMLYTANQDLHSIGDLLKIYLHPRMLDVFSIPFFRPSGHFLLYQLLMPFLGWHNTQGLIIVNLIFLALTGFLMVKTYEILFPGFRAGGYLAFGIYLMHPALLLSRLIALHFEFAYIFFCLLSFYCFALFCREENKAQAKQLPAVLLFYVVAVTFKEPALILGPVLACYFCTSLYRGGSLSAFFHGLTHNKIALQVLALLTVTTLALAFYLSLAWPSLAHPLGAAITTKAKLAATAELVKNLLGFPTGDAARALLQKPHLLWRELTFTPFTQVILGSFFLLSLLAGLRLVLEKKEAGFEHRKTLLFLSLAACLCLALPVNWAMGLPWHLSQTVLFLSLIAGFSIEYLARQQFKSKDAVYLGVLLLSVLVGLNARSVNQVNLAHVTARAGFPLALARNAVLHPPVLEEKLTAATVLLVEDSFLHDSYALGNSSYPLFLKPGLIYDELEKAQAFSFLKYKPIYNGYLFRWAYLAPALQEEVYPFEVDHLNAVPDAVIHNWLQHYDHLVCLGYDRKAQWHERTAEFKRNLLQEKARRLLQVHPYLPHAAEHLAGNVLYTKTLSLPDHRICQYECDQNVRCKGFTYENARYHYHSTVKCQFYDSLAAREKGQFCATCIGFVKG